MNKFLKEKGIAILLLSIIFTFGTLFWTSDVVHNTRDLSSIDIGWPVDFVIQNHSRLTPPEWWFPNNIGFGLPQEYSTSIYFLPFAFSVTINFFIILSLIFLMLKLNPKMHFLRKIISVKYITGAIALMFIGLVIILVFNHLTRTKMGEGIPPSLPPQSANIKPGIIATTTSFIPPTLSISVDSFDRVGTTTFTSKMLGIKFDYPRIMGILTEKILPPDDEKGGLFEKWSIFYTEPPVDKYSDFSIRADNKITANYVYEGCGPMFKYYGQSLENICNTKEFLNTDIYDVELNQCELRESKEKVKYVYFEAKGISHCNYGKLDAKNSVFLLVSRTHASISPQWPMDTYAGVFFKTQSDKYPGMSFTVSSIEWIDNATMLPYSRTTVSDVLPIQNIQIIERIANTLNYNRPVPQ